MGCPRTCPVKRGSWAETRPRPEKQSSLGRRRTSQDLAPSSEGLEPDHFHRCAHHLRQSICSDLRKLGSVRPHFIVSRRQLLEMKPQQSQLSQYHNVQVSERRPGPRLAKMVRNGSRVVARPRESTHMNPMAISWRLGPVPRSKTIKNELKP